MYKPDVTTLNYFDACPKSRFYSTLWLLWMLKPSGVHSTSFVFSNSSSSCPYSALSYLTPKKSHRREWVPPSPLFPPPLSTKRTFDSRGLGSCKLKIFVLTRVTDDMAQRSDDHKKDIAIKTIYLAAINSGYERGSCSWFLEDECPPSGDRWAPLIYVLSGCLLDGMSGFGWFCGSWGRE